MQRACALHACLDDAPCAFRWHCFARTRRHAACAITGIGRPDRCRTQALPAGHDDASCASVAAASHGTAGTPRAQSQVSDEADRFRTQYRTTRNDFLPTMRERIAADTEAAARVRRSAPCTPYRSVAARTARLHAIAHAASGRCGLLACHLL